MRWCRRCLLLLALMGVAACGRQANQPLFGLSLLSPAMVVSASENGRYAVSSHEGKNLVLWDIERRTHEIISDNANVYSAYFVQGRDIFLWQDLDDVVHVQHVGGEVLERFKHFPTYGHAMASDLETYLASDEDWGLYLGDGAAMQPLKDDGDSPSFAGIGKLLNLAVDGERGIALSAGRGLDGRDGTPISASPPRVDGQLSSRYAGVVLWDLDTREPLHKLPGNASKTHATLSPDGQYVIAVDENEKSFVWAAADGTLQYRVSLLGSGVYVGGHELGSPKNRDTSGMHLQHPEDFPEDFSGGPEIAVRFISDNSYFAFFTDYPYAVLYRTGDPFAHEIMSLGEDPFPAVSDYSRNAAIASAPAANLLVTGQRSGGGINVYRFDPEAQTLERIWAPRP